VTDIEFIDGYPSKLNSYAIEASPLGEGRLAALPWLRGKTKDRKGNVIKNPLSLISRWKILDNLRRSIVAPSITLLIALGFSICRAVPFSGWGPPF